MLKFRVKCLQNVLKHNRPLLHGFRRHLGCWAVAAKITANVWDIVEQTVFGMSIVSTCKKKNYEFGK